MAHVGEILEQPLTGERLTFLETAATTGGDFLKISMEMAPGGRLPCLMSTRGRRSGLRWRLAA